MLLNMGTTVLPAGAAVPKRMQRFPSGCNGLLCAEKLARIGIRIPLSNTDWNPRHPKNTDQNPHHPCRERRFWYWVQGFSLGCSVFLTGAGVSEPLNN